MTYTTSTRSHSFIPLNTESENTIDQILSETEVGRDYGWILGDSKNVPIIVDAEGKTISFPPIINASVTTVTTKTTNLLVEVTSLDKDAAEDMLSVVVAILQIAGFDIVQLTVSGKKNGTPKLNSRTIQYSPKLTEQTIGLSLNQSTTISSLKKCRLDATQKGRNIQCVIPRYRFDIFGSMDIVEEIALGYGIDNIEPKLSPSQTLGEKSSMTKKLDRISKTVIGFGFTEALNSSLTSKKILFDLTNRDSSEMLSVLDSKSQEHTILRDSILPGLLENLSKNIHEPYPQKLFETGTVFSKSKPISETINLAGIIAHKESNYSETKSILQAILRTGFQIDTKTITSEDNVSMFANGRYADVFVGKKLIGNIGEFNSDVLDNFKIRTSITGFEIKLSGLIFD